MDLYEGQLRDASRIFKQGNFYESLIVRLGWWGQLREHVVC